MKKLFFAVMIGLLILLPLRGAQEQKEAKADIYKNLQLVEKAEALPPRLQPGYDSITAKSLMTMLAFLSSDNLEGREIGTRGYDTAAEYAQSLLALWGLEPGGDVPKAAGAQMRQMGAEKPVATATRSFLQEFELKEVLESSASRHTGDRPTRQRQARSIVCTGNRFHLQFQRSRRDQRAAGIRRIRHQRKKPRL